MGGRPPRTGWGVSLGVLAPRLSAPRKGGSALAAAASGVWAGPRARTFSSQGAAEEPPAAAPCPPALQLLLKDPAPAVRVKAAETLGRLVKLA